MKFLLTLTRRLLLQILLLLLCYFISRVVFASVNAAYFSGLSVRSFLRLAFFGMRFDLSAILVTNALYWLFVLLPLPLWRMPVWERFTQWLFVAGNATVLLFELSDWAYFPFNHKRSTADVLDMITRKGDFFSLLPGFVADYWYVPLAWLAMVFLLYKVNGIIRKRTPLSSPVQRPLPMFGLQFLYLAIFTGLMIAGIRGGLQPKPIVLADALVYTQNEYAPVVINTPFSIISSLSNSGVAEVKYMSDAVMRSYINPVKSYSNRSAKKVNVVVIILESFSKEFTGMGRGKSYTPFLDSLMTVSLNCTNAYANALRSAEGIPAIIAGIPALMQEPITTSRYGSNKITALPGVLARRGYTSAFYHGGDNGTMSFHLFCKNAGFDKYYGRIEYNNDADYDGNWGIWDEPYLQYFAKNLNDMQQPFMATVFTLSSHPPYALPEKYKRVISEGKIPIETVVSYTDMALRGFFETAAKQPWYNNTLFVITADHTSMMREEEDHYSRNLGLYAIPMLFFAPGDTALRGQFSEPVQHIDILPSVLNYTGYSDSFFAFGNSIFSNEHRFVANAINQSYQFYMNGLLLVTTGTKADGLYAYPADSAYQNNLLPQNPNPAEGHLNYLKAFIQLYSTSMNKNTMWIEPGKK